MHVIQLESKGREGKVRERKEREGKDLMNYSYRLID